MSCYFHRGSDLILTSLWESGCLGEMHSLLHWFIHSNESSYSSVSICSCAKGKKKPVRRHACDTLWHNLKQTCLALHKQPEPENNPLSYEGGTFFYFPLISSSRRRNTVISPGTLFSYGITAIFHAPDDPLPSSPGCISLSKHFCKNCYLLGPESKAVRHFFLLFFMCAASANLKVVISPRFPA